MSNSFSCAGNLGQDAVVEMAGNTPVLKFSVANNIGWGEKRQTMWIGCSLFGQRAEKLQQFLPKGTKVFVYGELSMNTSSQGKSFLNLNVSDVDVIAKAEGAAGQPQQGGFQQQAPQQNFAPQAPAAPQQGGFPQQAPQQNFAPQQQAPQQNFAPQQQPVQQPTGAPQAPAAPPQGATPFDQAFT